MLDLTLDASQTEAYLRRIVAGKPAVMARALNRGITSGRLAMVKAIAADTGLKSADIRARIILREATPARLEASLEASRKRIPLIDFGAKGPEPTRGKGRGVTVKLRGSAQRYPSAFIATMASGHRGVFARAGAGARRSASGWGLNLPIYELFGPSIGKVFGKFRDVGIARAMESVATNLASGIRQLLRAA